MAGDWLPVQYCMPFIGLHVCLSGVPLTQSSVVRLSDWLSEFVLF